MPRTLKRRADAGTIHSPDDSPDEDERPRQRQRSSSTSSSNSNHSDGSDSDPTNSQATLIKKLVRLALSAEYSRQPIRRADISAKVLGEAHSRQFKTVFAETQKVLKETFGMQLVELPSREKTTLKDRRNQATQTKVSSTSSKSWILLSILPTAYKSSHEIVQPTRSPNIFNEASYTALYTFILSLIYLNQGTLAEAKLERYLKRVDADTYTPLGTIEKLLARMSKEGYIEKRRDTSSGDEVVEWISGARGKMEVGARGVVGLVKAIYADGDAEVDEDDLDLKLEKSLGIKLKRAVVESATGNADFEMNGAEDQHVRKTGRRGEAAVGEDSDDD